MNKIIICIVVSFLTGCSSTNDDNFINVDTKTYQKPVVTRPITKAYIHTSNAQNIILDSDISINVQNVSLLDAITKEKPSINILALDDGVMLDKKISIRSNKIKFSDYLSQLGRLTGYRLSMNNNKIEVSSRISKTWNLATLASLPTAQSSIKNQSSNNTQNSNSIVLDGNKEWLDVIANIKALIANDKNNAKILSSRILGTISVTASPDDIDQIDEYLNQVILSSNKQVSLEITVLDVAFNDKKSSGLDFNILTNGVNGAFGISNKISNAVESTFKLGSINDTKPFTNGNVTADIILNLLNQHGRAKIISRPIILLTNGMSSQFGGVNNIKFISKINAVPDKDGNVVLTSDVEDLEVGLQMSVTVRLVDDKRILVQLVPSVSSVVSYTDVVNASADNEQRFQLPNVSLQSLLTQVIVEDGKSIVVGGLVSRKIIDNIKSFGSFFSFLDGENYQSEHREIFFLIKATILN